MAGARSKSALAAQQTVPQLVTLLAERWPDAYVELDHENAFQLLVATILAAQSTDKMINTITPALFAKYPDASALAAADPIEVEPLIFKSGFYRNKAKAIVGMARALVERHGGNVPTTMEELVELPGVARKTANVVLGNALGKAEGVVVDTHVTRLSQRLGLTRETDPVKIEQDLVRLLPRDEWTKFSNRLIWHGRRICDAKKPDHDNCLLAPLCPSATLVTLSPKKPSPRGKSVSKPTQKKPPSKKPARAKMKRR
jgi:endonuclease III